MRPILAACLLAFALAALPPAARAGWDEGETAFRRGDWAVAARELKPLSEAGDARAQARYGRMLLDGHGMPQNEAEGVKLLQDAADKRDPAGQTYLAHAYIRGRGGLPHDQSTALILLGRAADQNFPEAIDTMGLFYVTGAFGLPRNTARGLEFLHRAADLGWPHSAYLLGLFYWSGKEVPRDRVQAVSWLAKAAEAGVSAAQGLLADSLWTGDGGPKDRDAALAWFQKAVAQGDAHAMQQLGVLYINGDGMPRDVNKGVDLLRRAAGTGDGAAALTLGRLYWEGNLVQKDQTLALPLLRQAADKGVPDAQNLVGLALWKGEGAERNQTEAVAWFRRAAEQGLAAAQYNLAQAYASGTGIDRNPVEAYAWHIAAAQRAAAGDKPRFDAARDKVAASLSPSEAERGRELAAARVAPPPAPAAATAVPASPDLPQPSQGKPRVNAGTGFFVGRDGIVLTDAHVVASCQSVRVTPSDAAKPTDATVLARDPVNDLAVLKTGLARAKAASFREDKPMRSGDSVVVIGYPLSSVLSREPNVTAGVISAMAGPRGDTRFFQITAPVQKGNSGGPLADMSGNVVGVVARKLNAMEIQKQFDDMPQNVNFATKADLVRKFLGDNKIAVETASAREILSAADVGERVKQVTAFVECLQ